MPSGTLPTKAARAEHVLGVAAVDASSRCCAGARHSVSQPDDAVLALAARPAEPRDGDAVAFGDARDAGTDPLHDADAFVPGDEGRRRLHRPVAVRGVDVGVAQARCLHLHQHLAGPGVGTATSSMRNGAPNSCTTAAFMRPLLRSMTVSIVRSGATGE